MSIKKNQRKSRGGHIAVLDIGSTKVACFIARQEAQGKLTVIGVGHQLSRGIRAGVITDVAEAQTSIVAAVHAAEQMAGETIENVIVNLSGGSLRSRHVTVQLAVSGEGVTEQDIADIIREGQESIRSGEQDIIHCFPVSYALDNVKNIRDPRQMVGHELGADLHLVTSSIGSLRNIALCIARCHLNVTEYVVSPHAAGLGCLEPDEMELGVTLIDMGGGVTSISVFHSGKNVFTDSIPIGGMHVTNDIAKGLSTTLAHAERLKTLHGSATPSVQDEQVMIDVPQLGEEEYDDGEGTQMPRSMLVGVIRPRLEELFEMVRGKLEASGVDMLAGRRVVITGGAAQLLGVRELAARALSKQVRLGKPHARMGLADAVSGPAFSTTAGMLEFTQNRPMEDAFFRARPAKLPLLARFDRIIGWVKQNF